MNPNPFAWSFRAQFFTGFLACLALLAYAIFEQFEMNTEPCTLCIFQRIAFIAMGVFFLVGAMHGPGKAGRRAYAVLVLLGAASGAAIAAYHLWVQQQPPDLLAGCAPGWNYMVENFPISKILKSAFTGHADCADINWTFLGLSMPFWTLLWFVALGGGTLWAGFRHRAAK
jgi:disulfide bond formation protein DsbB